MDTDRIDLILQFALLTAGDEDDVMDRRLGSIHLIKYVYLADLFFAEANAGATFTGTSWQFYKFGPWSQPVHDRIEPALTAIHADKMVYTTAKDGGEWERWSLTDDVLRDQIVHALPACITLRLRHYVHRYLADTPDLLAFVYNTSPMRSAAPDEQLDFSLAAKARAEHTEPAESVPPLTIKQKKMLKKGISRLREKLAEKKAADTKRQTFRPPEPLYDDVYFAGLEWLDSLAGKEMPVGELKAVFADTIWKSPARIDDDFPG